VGSEFDSLCKVLFFLAEDFPGNRYAEQTSLTASPWMLMSQKVGCLGPPLLFLAPPRRPLFLCALRRPCLLLMHDIRKKLRIFWKAADLSFLFRPILRDFPATIRFMDSRRFFLS